MAYYLASGSSKNEQLLLPIRKLRLFTPLTNLINNESCSLKEIDMFTSQFSSEDELKEYLFKENILPLDMLDKPLSIKCLYKKEYKKVSYGLLYNDSLEYINNPNLLGHDLYNRYLKGDYGFLREMANVFKYDKGLGIFATDTINASSISIDTNSHYSKLFDEPVYYTRDEKKLKDYKQTDLVKGFLMKILYDTSERSLLTNSGTTYVQVFRNKLNYRNFHRLLAFTKYYDSNHYSNSITQNSSVNAKTRTLKKSKDKPIELDQISIFDKNN